jgi:putative aldouronate transport system substrate-binding protein
MWKRNINKSALIWISTSIGLMALTGCLDHSAKPSDHSAQPFRITMLNTSHETNEPKLDNQVWKQMEAYTDTKVEVEWVPNASYNDKLNIVLASGTLPMIIKADSPKLPSVVNAIKAGAFWEIGPYLKEYPNLQQADPNILYNIAIEGKSYGLYRARQIGRLGISFRQDWLARVGLQEPKTIEDFYQMLKAFTYKDPDRNGKDDTYGLVMTKYSAPWDIMQVWFGAPNKWGKDASGKLIPTHMTAEYMDALRFFRKLYAEGLVNADFPVFDPSKWYDPILNGKAGVLVDVVDAAGRLESGLLRANSDGVINAIASVEGPQGLRNLPTSGYSGVFLISKSSVKTEGELRKVLAFLDKLNDKEMQLLLGYGIEGMHYTTQGGRLMVAAPSDIPVDYRLNDLGQMLMMIPDRTVNMFKPPTPLREKINRIYEENKSILVMNPGEPFDSATYMQRGALLDSMIEDARTKFIVGKLDEAGFLGIVELWRKQGGDAYIQEMNEAYGQK